MRAILIAKGKDKGFLLSDEIIAAFPNAEADVSRLDDFYSSLLAYGIEVVDQRPTPIKRPAPPPAAPSPSSKSRQEQSRTTEQADPVPTPSGVADDIGGVGDSVRLYLQEIGETSLLTMDQEIWLAKRMERGKLAAGRVETGSYG